MGAILYNFCGFVIHSQIRSKQKKLNCELCLFYLTASSPQVGDEQLSALVKLRDYTGKSLIHCSKRVFYEVFVPLEKMFLKLEQEPEFFTKDDFVTLLIAQGKELVPDILPSCHDIQEKLVTKFLNLRNGFAVKAIGKRRRLAAKEKQKKKLGKKKKKKKKKKK